MALIYTARGSDYDEWKRLIATADKPHAPNFRFGRYVHPSLPRDVLRQSDEGRMLLLSKLPLPLRGRSHERASELAPFVFWDGEGITYTPGMPQSYVLFGNSIGHEISDRELRTVDCLNLIIQAEQDFPTAIHVAFSFKYDAEMILVDLPLRHWYVLKQRGSVRFGKFQITYHPGRIFRVSQMVGEQRYTATIYDVFGFFQQSFIKALRAWMDESELNDIQKVEDGKGQRGTFNYDSLTSFIIPYWRAENRLGTALCERLRERLRSAHVCPSQWHGAGALASTLYRSHDVRRYMARESSTRTDRDVDVATELPKQINECARLAYAGGRFELYRLGHAEGPIYQYDIRSAYPAAITTLPSLRQSEWEHRLAPRFDASLFALWHIEYDSWQTQQVFSPGPLFQRDEYGRVAYPLVTDGWYWTPEASLVACNPEARITEAWVCHHEDVYPFQWVHELYEERAQRKAAGDPSEKAYKLALNSLYGKMAQRLGWQRGNPLPRFHQLEWAGWVTSYTRMMLYAAMREADNDLIAVETDAVFTTKPLSSVTVGAGLGEWECTEHAWITYLQSGTYWSDKGAKYRGFDAGSLDYADAMSWLRRGDFSQPLVGTTTRFVGAGRGLGTPQHRTWVTEARDMQPGRSGKRLHLPELCRPCSDGVPPSDQMHPLMIGTKGGASSPHKLPWVDDNAPGLEWQELEEIESWDAFE